MGDLTVIERAVKALDVNEAALRELVKESVEIVTVTNSAGFQQAQTARMKLRAARINVEKMGKGAREDATAFSKAVIEKEKQYVAILTPEETRLQSLQDEYNAKIEAEKQAKIQAEIDRKNALALKISELDHGLKFGDNSAMIRAKLERIESIEIDATYEEREYEALQRKIDSARELNEALGQVIAAEEAAAAEIIKREAEKKAEELRIENERKQAEERAARELAESETKKQREIAEAAQREADRLKAAEIAEQQRIEAAKRAEQERVAAEERAKLEAKAKADREARIKAEHEAAELRAQAEAAEAARKIAEDARIEAERKAAAAPDKEKMLAYAEALLNVPRPSYETVAAKEAGVNMEQAVLNLHKRIVAKANEL